MIEAGGQRQLLVWYSKALASLNPETGEVYWSEALDPNYGMSIVTPRVSGDLLFVGGIVNKSMMLKLDANQPRAKVHWYGDADVGIDPVHGTPFAEDGYLYGVNRSGRLSAAEALNPLSAFSSSCSGIHRSGCSDSG